MAQCRICFEDASLNELIAPCLCDGTSKYVHDECLNRWRHTTQRAFLKCVECNFPYKVIYEYPLERYKFVIPSTDRDTGIYLSTLIMVLFASFFLRNVEIILGYPSLSMLNLGYTYNKTYKEILDYDEIYSGCYFFALNNYYISFFSYFSFLFLILYNVKRLSLYWKSFKIPFILRYFLSLHFIWGYWMLGSHTEEVFKMFIISDASISLFNIWTFIGLLREHNRIINFMNSQKNATTILSRVLVDNV